MQERGGKKILFCLQKKEKNASHLIIANFQSKVFLLLLLSPPPRRLARPSFLFWSRGLGSRASPGNNQNNFQLGRKEMEFQMKDEQEGL